MEDAKSSEKEMVTEHQQLMGLLHTEQKKSEKLMIPPPKPKGGFWSYLRLKK